MLLYDLENSQGHKWMSYLVEVIKVYMRTKYCVCAGYHHKEQT